MTDDPCRAVGPARPLAEITRAAERRVAALAAGRNPALLARVDAAIALLDQTMPGRGHRDLPAELFPLVGDDAGFVPLLAARLLAGIAARRPARAVPDPVLPELQRQAMRILTLDAASLDDDGFLKDLSICLLLSFPCGAQVVEQTGCLPRMALPSGGITQAMQLARHLAATGYRPGPYLEIHTHTPMLGDFNPAGWERCYKLVADLLALRPDCLGMIGGSWFYDPALAMISPRLTYLADTPIAGGAFRIRLGHSEADTGHATATSPTRRKLVAEGRYLPTRWLLIWPREALLTWAASRTGAIQ